MMYRRDDGGIHEYDHTYFGFPLFDVCDSSRVRQTCDVDLVNSLTEVLRLKGTSCGM